MERAPVRDLNPCGPGNPPPSARREAGKGWRGVHTGRGSRALQGPGRMMAGLVPRLASSGKADGSRTHASGSGDPALLPLSYGLR